MPQHSPAREIRQREYALAVNEGRKCRETVQYSTNVTSAHMIQFMPTSKSHHFLSQHHLAQFCAGDGNLHVYDVDGRSFRTTPKAVAAETHLYRTVETQHSPSNDFVEQWLANVIDGPAAPVIDKIIAGNNHLTSDEAEALTLFMVVQDMRTPLVRDRLMAFLTENAAVNQPRVIAQTIAEYEAEHGPISADMRSVAEKMDLTPNKNAWLNMMMQRAVRVTLEIIGKVKFFRAHAPRSLEWITNDIGLVKFSGSFTHPIPYISGVHTLVWLMPINQRDALAMAPKSATLTPILRPNDVRNINRRIASDAVRHVYAHSEADWVRKWLKRPANLTPKPPTI